MTAVKILTRDGLLLRTVFSIHVSRVQECSLILLIVSSVVFLSYAVKWIQNWWHEASFFTNPNDALGRRAAFVLNAPRTAALVLRRFTTQQNACGVQAQCNAHCKKSIGKTRRGEKKSASGLFWVILSVSTVWNLKHAFCGDLRKQTMPPFNASPIRSACRRLGLSNLFRGWYPLQNYTKFGQNVAFLIIRPCLCLTKSYFDKCSIVNRLVSRLHRSTRFASHVLIDGDCVSDYFFCIIIIIIFC